MEFSATNYKDMMSLILLTIFAVLCVVLNFIPVQFHPPVEHAEMDDLTWVVEEQTTASPIS